MSRVFFDAYCRATKDLAAEEDRFPSLSEIDLRMESGAVYAFKDRLMKNTQFFEEVKVSGVSYLVPHARRFIDSSVTYTDLELDFAEGRALLPSRRKAPSIDEVRQAQKDKGDAPFASARSSKMPDSIAVQDEDFLESKQPDQKIAVPSGDEEIVGKLEVAEETSVLIEAEPPAVETVVSETVVEGEHHPSADVPISGEQKVVEVQGGAAAEEIERGDGQPFVEADRAVSDARDPIHSDVDSKEDELEVETAKVAIEPKEGVVAAEERALLQAVSSTPTSAPPSETPAPTNPKFRLQMLLSAAFILLVLGSAMFAWPHLFPANEAVQYAAYLTNDSVDGAFILNIQNTKSLASEIEMMLPPNIDRSISSKGGLVTISHSNGTIIKLSAKGDASIGVYLNRKWTSVPVTMTLQVPEGYDSGLDFHEKNYDVKRKGNRIILSFSVTNERVLFEQSYRLKRS
jgi:hypothetical protein